MSADIRLLCCGQPPYITRLMRCEHRNINRNVSDEESVVHLINELVTPEVPYATWNEFVNLVYQIQDEYCSCVVTAFDVAREEMRVSVVRGQVHFLNTADLPTEFPHLQIHGRRLIARLTKNNGVMWCEMVAHLIYSGVLREAAVYADVLSITTNEDNFDDQNFRHGMIKTMQREVCNVFAGALPLNIYSLCSGFTSSLLVKNFTLFDNPDLFAVTNQQFSELLLTLCMGLHARLGKLSPLNFLEEELLCAICARVPASILVKHIVFHSQEQWLVA
jgi:hypothetical protein